MPNHPAIAQPERESLTHKATLPDRVMYHLRVGGITEKAWTKWYFDGCLLMEKLYESKPADSRDKGSPSVALRRLYERAEATTLGQVLGR